MVVQGNENLQVILLYLIKTHYSDVYVKHHLDIFPEEDKPEALLLTLRDIAVQYGNEFIFALYQNKFDYDFRFRCWALTYQNAL